MKCYLNIEKMLNMGSLSKEDVLLPPGGKGEGGGGGRDAEAAQWQRIRTCLAHVRMLPTCAHAM